MNLDEKDMLRAAIVILILYSIILLFVGFEAGSLFREDVDFKQCLIREYNVSSRLCMSGDALSYCKRLNDNECGIWKDNAHNQALCENDSKGCVYDYSKSITRTELDPNTLPLG